MGKSLSRRWTGARRAFQMSIASGAGTFLGLVPQLIVGMVLFVVGLQVRASMPYVGVALMFVGCALAVGFGSETLLSEMVE